MMYTEVGSGERVNARRPLTTTPLEKSEGGMADLSIRKATGYGLCECGCGAKTAIANGTDHRYGSVRGQPRRFIKGHGKRGNTRRIDEAGYVMVLDIGNPRGFGRGWVQEHLVIVELTLG